MYYPSANPAALIDGTVIKFCSIKLGDKYAITNQYMAVLNYYCTPLSVCKVRYGNFIVINIKYVSYH